MAAGRTGPGKPRRDTRAANRSRRIATTSRSRAARRGRRQLLQLPQQLANTQAVYDRIRPTTRATAIRSRPSSTARRAASSCRWPRAAAMAAGLELRKEDLNDYSDPVLTTGDVLGRGSTQAKGSATYRRPTWSSACRREERGGTARRAHRPLQRLRSVVDSQGGRALERRSVAPAARDLCEGLPGAVDPRKRRVERLLLSRTCRTRRAARSTHLLRDDLGARFVLGQPGPEAREERQLDRGIRVGAGAQASIGIDYYYIKQRDIVSSRDFSSSSTTRRAIPST
jgi:hypothetical protein